MKRQSTNNPAMKQIITAVFCTLAAPLSAAPLSPADPSLAADLLVWLKDAQTNFNPATGVWKDASGKLDSQGQPYDAAAVGLVQGVAGVGGYTTPNITWKAPELTLVAGGGLAADRKISGVVFSSSVNDLMGTPPLKDGAALGTDVTIIAIYRLTTAGGSTISNTRPVGFGSMAATGGVTTSNYLNLAIDPSIRKDNGNVSTGYLAPHPGGLFVRSCRKQSVGTIHTFKEWFNYDGTPTVALDYTGATANFSIASNRLFLGDVRGGATGVQTATSTAPSDFTIVEVAAFGRALTDEEIADVNESMLANLPDAVLPPFQITKVQHDPAAGSLQVVWNAEPDISYQIQTSESLLSDSWTTVGTVTTKSLSASTLLPAATLPSPTRSFVRVVRP
jgi:hypothetical protein